MPTVHPCRHAEVPPFPFILTHSPDDEETPGPVRGEREGPRGARVPAAVLEVRAGRDPDDRVRLHPLDQTVNTMNMTLYLCTFDNHRFDNPNHK